MKTRARPTHLRVVPERIPGVTSPGASGLPPDVEAWVIDLPDALQAWAIALSPTDDGPRGVRRYVSFRAFLFAARPLKHPAISMTIGSGL